MKFIYSLIILLSITNSSYAGSLERELMYLELNQMDIMKELEDQFQILNIRINELESDLKKNITNNSEKNALRFMALIAEVLLEQGMSKKEVVDIIEKIENKVDEDFQ